MARSGNSRQLAERRRQQFRSLISGNKTFPLATITYHGPSPEQASKIIVGILSGQDQAPLIRTWTGAEIAEDENCAREIAAFIGEHAVARVITSEWVLSCPHEEGVDYPVGEACPHCPDWR